MADITLLPDSISDSRSIIDNNFDNLNEAVIDIESTLDVNLNDFITTEAGEFRLGAERFRYVGGNNYPLIQNNYTQAQLNSFFKYCVQDGIKVVRTWCFNKNAPATNAAGNFRYLSGGVLYWREATFAQLDLVLATARAFGVKLILPLVDENGGNKADYVTWYNTINGTAYVADNFHTVAGIKQYYKDFIFKLANRVNTINRLAYKDDPTIFCWELGNELRYITGTDTNPNTVNSTRLATMTAWMDEMSSYIKSVLPNHLIGSGGINQFYDFVNNDSFHNGTYYALDFRIQHALPNIDVCSIHDYPFTDNPIFVFKALGQANGYPAQTITSLTAVGTTVTATKAGHGLSTGDHVKISGTNDAPNQPYNGWFIVTVSSSSVFTYTALSAPSATPATGTFYLSKATQAGFLAQMQEYVTAANLLNKPIIMGEYGIDKRNTLTTGPNVAYPRATHALNVMNDLFGIGFDGFLWWHYSTASILDDNNYNIKPDGIHVAPYANTNDNDNDGTLIEMFRNRIAYNGLPNSAVNPDAARGDLFGSTSSVDNAIPRFDGVTGKQLQGSGVVLDDNDEINVPNDKNIKFLGDGVSINGNNVKTGTDGTMILAAGSGNNVKIELGANDGSKRAGFTDRSFIFVWSVDSTGKSDSIADSMRLRTAKTPASATAAGSQGDICWDASYIYVCVATNTWKRVAIATW